MIVWSFARIVLHVNNIKNRLFIDVNCSRIVFNIKIQFI